MDMLVLVMTHDGAWDGSLQPLVRCSTSLSSVPW